jgi:tRNA(Ile)-lysidine synthase
MKNPLVKVVKDFLTEHLKGSQPVLIGLSGGVDSSALFSLLLECRSSLDFNLHVVHFDHGWRVESSLEACKLQEFVQGLSVMFHGERVDDVDVVNQSNLEDIARQQRFAFFQKVYKKVGAQAIMLAHQREDQAETVLKRLFEGAGVLSLGGMESSSVYEGMKIWRPLLSVSREDLCKWNDGKGWTPYQDRTNDDPRFLRPRMRLELFPHLQKCFGKNICHSLARVSKELTLLKSSIERRLVPYLDQELEGSLGVFLPVREFVGLDSWERQELVRLFLKKRKATISYSALKTALDLLEESVIDKKIDVSFGELWVDRGALLWLQSSLPVFQGMVPFSSEGLSVRQGDWIWEVRESQEPLLRQRALSGFLSGEVSFSFKKGSSLAFSSYDELYKKDQERISQYLSKNKISSRLKRMFPYIINEAGFVCCSFCFGNNLNRNEFFDFSNIILKKSCELKDNIFPFCYASDEWE